MEITQLNGEVNIAGILESKDGFAQDVLRDFWIACVSREASILSRKEVLTGKAKFGISGDGKEVPQVALARFFRKGDFRSGYYRDQTMIFALGVCTLEDYFAQLYADSEHDVMSGGRQMSSHFASRFIDESGNWLNLRDLYNITSDISPTAGQMARGLGLALASKKFRELEQIEHLAELSDNGNEVVFCTIGDASTSEGVFFETINAACVMQVPMVVSVWDDGYGISVPRHLQTAKDSISRALEGFLTDQAGSGMHIYTVKAWDYAGLCEVYQKATTKARELHAPVLVHVEEVTQPQGHSTSGSHERYKSTDRLKWEQDFDCIQRMGEWMIQADLISEEQVDHVKAEAKKYAKACKDRAWKNFSAQASNTLAELSDIYTELLSGEAKSAIEPLYAELQSKINPGIAEIIQNARRLRTLLNTTFPGNLSRLDTWIETKRAYYHHKYTSGLYADDAGSALKVPEVTAVYSDESPELNGFQILNTFFDKSFAKHKELLAFGEDLGHIGDVNQGFAGLQEKHGVERIYDTAIREWTIVGQAIGLAMRGFRPIAEIQYLDYLIYALSPLSDDLATLRYRSAGLQKAPVIIRTRGHRLEGIWHSGSPMGMILNSLRGMYVLTPRNMTQAAGMYNTMLQSDDPALIIECLNGYRLKERLPDNILEFTVPLGRPEVLQQGEDVTLLTYGSCVRIVEEAIVLLKEHGISVELIDAQTLLPFDIHHVVAESVKKTNRLMVVDEDVPGGASAYLMREVLEIQQAYKYLDSAPITLTAKANRPPYGSDGDYFTKPNPEDVFEAVYNIMHEAEPATYPLNYKIH